MPTPDCTISVRAHAKLNLALWVGAPVEAPGSLAHGYHPICSWFHCVDLCDRVTLTRLDAAPSAHEIGWVRPDGGIDGVEWSIEDDLCVRAHRALEARAGRELPCRVVARKSIPAGGGLGGGSSDAAAVLMGLDALFGLGLGEDGLREVAMTLGSDIAFFIDAGIAGGDEPPRPAIVGGMGERIERLARPHAGTQITLIFPPFGCGTGAVYRAFDAGLADRADTDENGPERVRELAGAGSIDAERLFNDLAPAAEAVEGRLADLRRALTDGLGRPVLVSGSGSTLFVIGPVDRARLGALAPGCRAVATTLR